MSTFILNRDIDVENMTIQDIAKHYEGEVERYKEHVKTLGDDFNVLAEEEKFAIAYIEAEEKRMAEFKGYVLPEKITIGNEDLSKAVIAGYIEGSKIRGGTIQIGDLGNDFWSFEVDEEGNVSMCGGSVIFKYDKEKQEYINSIKIEADRIDGIIEGLNGEIYYLQNQVTDINAKKMYRVEIFTEDSQIIKSKDQTATLTCKIYSWDEDVTDQALGSDYGEALKDTTYVSLIRWKRKSNNSTADEAWNEEKNDDGTYRHVGKTLTIGPDDIAHNASFYCEVNIPDKSETTK